MQFNLIKSFFLFGLFHAKILFAQPLVVFVCGDHEYSGEHTLPLIAEDLEEKYGFRTKILSAYPNQNAEENIPGLEILAEADLAVFFLRWRRLPAEQINQIENYLKSGKPVLGFRTTTHAFNYPKGHPLEKWNAFGEMAFNAPPGWGGKAGHTHYGHLSTSKITLINQNRKNPILKGIEKEFEVPSWLYHVVPNYPSGNSTPLLLGTAINPDKAAVANPVAWIGTNSYGAKFFMTTMGHPEDFKNENLQKIVINATHWLLDKKSPKWKGKIDINVPYRGITP